jgi:hypothetical protein
VRILQNRWFAKFARKDLAKILFALSNDEIAKLVQTGVYKEIQCDG